MKAGESLHKIQFEILHKIKAPLLLSTRLEVKILQRIYIKSINVYAVSVPDSTSWCSVRTKPFLSTAKRNSPPSDAVLQKTLSSDGVCF